jgi:hypothetical protein
VGQHLALLDLAPADQPVLLLDPSAESGLVPQVDAHRAHQLHFQELLLDADDLAGGLGRPHIEFEYFIDDDLLDFGLLLLAVGF